MILLGLYLLGVAGVGLWQLWNVPVDGFEDAAAVLVLAFGWPVWVGLIVYAGWSHGRKQAEEQS